MKRLVQAANIARQSVFSKHGKTVRLVEDISGNSFRLSSGKKESALWDDVICLIISYIS